MVVSGKDNFPKVKTVALGLKGWVQLSGTTVQVLAPEPYFSTCFKETEGKLGRCLPGILSTYHTKEFSSSPEPHPTWAISMLTALGLSSWSVRHQGTLEKPFSKCLLPATLNLPELFLGPEQANLGIILGPDTGRSCGEVEMLGVEKAEGVN